MDIFFSNPNEVPLPPADVRIRELRAEPYPDGRRVRVYLEVDPFQKRPSAELLITNPDGQPVASASILESMMRKIEITLHLRGETPPGVYKLDVELYFAERAEAPPGSPPPEPIVTVVDRAQTEFTVENIP